MERAAVRLPPPPTAQNVPWGPVVPNNARALVCLATRVVAVLPEFLYPGRSYIDSVLVLV
jgi:hypothetical protein